jgi:hypothetical protein
MAKHMGSRIISWIEESIEGRLALGINKEKTTIVDVNKQGSYLNFLGFSEELNPIEDPNHKVNMDYLVRLHYHTS